MNEYQWGSGFIAGEDLSLSSLLHLGNMSILHVFIKMTAATAFLSSFHTEL